MTETKRQKLCVEVAQYLGLSNVAEYKDMQPELQGYFNAQDDKQLVAPLIDRDRRRGLSISQLSRKYALSIRAVRTVLDRICRNRGEI